MRLEHAKHLVCPQCRGILILNPTEFEDDQIKEGILSCATCQKSYPITRYVPRFVSDHNYAAGFGFQWNKHFQTQYDRYSGAPISAKRYFNETSWGYDLSGQIILEAGCGSGRFTEHAASTGAVVISFDYSNAVDANSRNNGNLKNVLIVQASVYEMPFRDAYFDKVFCIGVIQHTPDPKLSFERLGQVLKSRGGLVVDAYDVLPWWKRPFETKYWVLPITNRMPPRILYSFCERWVNIMWGITGLAWKLTGRRFVSWMLLVADYRGVYPLSDAMLKEWSVLDTFDMLSPKYDFPQTIASVTEWFRSGKYTDIEVFYGFNGVTGRGRKP